MKKTEIESLLRYLSNGDKDGILSCLRRAAASETSAGRENNGIFYEGIASKIERKAPFEARMLNVLQPSDKIRASLAAFLARVPTKSLQDIILPEKMKEEVLWFLQEHAQSEVLEKHLLTPRNRVLLTGPPGSGKTLLAEILAKETKKEFHILQMGSLMDSLLGNTIRNIENSFAAIAVSNGVFLFDEFDALSTARQTKSDVNEMRRALNALLQCFENHTGKSIVVAATNHPQSIDPAFRRRFHAIWETQNPTKHGREILIEKTCSKHLLPQEKRIVEELAQSLNGLSFDECEHITKKLIATAVLTGQTKIDTCQKEQARAAMENSLTEK